MAFWLNTGFPPSGRKVADRQTVVVEMMNNKVISEIKTAGGRRRPGSARHQPARLHKSLLLMRFLSFTPKDAWLRSEGLLSLTLVSDAFYHNAVKRLYKHGGIPDRRIPM